MLGDTGHRASDITRDFPVGSLFMVSRVLFCDFSLRPAVRQGLSNRRNEGAKVIMGYL